MRYSLISHMFLYSFLGVKKFKQMNMLKSILTVCVRV